MLGLKKLLFKSASPIHLAADVRAALEAWRASPAPALDEVHFHTRYVVVDIATSGPKADSDQLLCIAAGTVQQAKIVPDDACFVDLARLDGEAPELDRQLAAFLQFAAKAPLVAYHVPQVGGFLQRLYRERLGVDFQPPWIDLAWLLPAMFEDKGDGVMPLDHWLERFGLDAGGRRDAMENTLLLARLFQMLLVRATARGIDSAARLVDESRASSFLRRTH